MIGNLNRKLEQFSETLSEQVPPVLTASFIGGGVSLVARHYLPSLMLVASNFTTTFASTVLNTPIPTEVCSGLFGSLGMLAGEALKQGLGKQVTFVGGALIAGQYAYNYLNADPEHQVKKKELSY